MSEKSFEDKLKKLGEWYEKNNKKNPNDSIDLTSDVSIDTNDKTPNTKIDSNTIGIYTKLYKFIHTHYFITSVILLSLAVIMVIFTMYMVHPFIVWGCISVLGIFIYLTFRPYTPITESYNEYERKNQRGVWDKTYNSEIHSFYDRRLITPEIHKSNDAKNRIGFGVVTLIIGVLLFLFAWGANTNDELFNAYMYRGVYTTSSKTDTILENNRISCVQIQHGVNRTVLDTTITIYKKYALFTPNSFDTTKKENKRYPIIVVGDTLNDTLVIDNVTCGDTIKHINRKSYTDRNFSLIKTNKKYINSKWQLDDTTYYTNQSPKINSWDLRKIFNNARAEYRYDTYITRYTVKLIDESKIDTLDSKQEAVELLSKKCKDKSTIAGKLVYAEYDACKNNNNVLSIKIETRKVCGYSTINIEYDRGVVSPTPYSCWDKLNSGWYYE